MIPKIAWIHWDGPAMSWLRQASVDSFAKQNPDWEVNVMSTPDDMANKGLARAHEADWHRWRLLSKYGGLGVDSDILHLKPIPEEWLDADICAQLHPTGHVHQMPVIGGSKGNRLWRLLEKYCESKFKEVAKHTPDPFDPDDSVYQAFGTDALKKVIRANSKQIQGRVGVPGDKTTPASYMRPMIYSFGRVCRISHEAFCFYGWQKGPRQIWSEQPFEELPEDAIGIHWYGGAEETKEREPTAHAGGPSWLERLASE